jgi:hypothetical protein
MNDLLRELADKQALTDLLSEYTIASDSYDAKRLGDLWLDDGVFEFPGGWDEPAVGRDEIIRKDFYLMELFESVQHTMLNPLFVIKGDVAEGRNNAIFHGCKDKNVPTSFVSGGGFYNWTFKRTDKGWKIQKGLVTQVWTSEVFEDKPQ